MMATMYGTSTPTGYGAYGWGMASGSQDASQDASQEKFWGTITRCIPIAVQLGRTLLAQQKGAGGGAVSVDDLAQDKNFLRILQSLLPIAAQVVQSLDAPSGMSSDTAPTPGPDQEKFWGTIARLVPIALQVGSRLLSQQKGAFAGPATLDEVMQDKGFLDILRTILPIASQVVNALDEPGGMASDTATPAATTGAEQEKFWGILAAVIPAAVNLVTSLVGGRKAVVSADDIAQDKGFFDILRAVLPIAARVVQNLDAPAGMASDAPASPEQEKFWGAIARLVPVAIQIGSRLLAQQKGAFGGPVQVEEVVQNKGFLDVLRALLPIATQVVGSLDQPGGMSGDMGSGSAGQAGIPSAFASAFR
ncbi:MAG: hypothetical protein IT306_27810 [Chloroflexi bacterium]|nr:hypothetical protein [Chloroflexota bacterium]